MSIHPKYVELIANGVKRVEFRRQRFARAITHIVIYATSPVKRLVGFCEVERVVTGTPTSLWSQHGEEGGISREALFQYLVNLKDATAIVLRPFYPIANELRLEAVGVQRPPQSFQYLTESAFAALKQRAA